MFCVFLVYVAIFRSILVQKKSFLPPYNTNVLTDGCSDSETVSDNGRLLVRILANDASKAAF